MEDIKVSSFDIHSIIKLLGVMLLVLIFIIIFGVIIRCPPVVTLITIFVLISLTLVGLISTIIEREVMLFNNDKMEIYFGKCLYLSIKWKEIKNIEITHEKFNVEFHTRGAGYYNKICNTINFKIHCNSNNFEYWLFWKNFPFYKQESILKNLKELLIKNSIPFEEKYKEEITELYKSGIIAHQHKQAKDSIKYKGVPIKDN